VGAKPARVAKGAVGTKPDGRRFLYHPLLERADYVGGESRRLVERLFGGRAAPLFAHLAESEALSDEDLAEIETLLKELRK
jgi:BlaI family penicillinase repressor